MTNKPDELLSCREAFEKWCDDNNIEALKSPSPDAYDAGFEVWQGAWNTKPTSTGDSELMKRLEAFQGKIIGFRTQEDYKNLTEMFELLKDCKQALTDSKDNSICDVCYNKTRLTPCPKCYTKDSKDGWRE